MFRLSASWLCEQDAGNDVVVKSCFKRHCFPISLVFFFTEIPPVFRDLKGAHPEKAEKTRGFVAIPDLHWFEVYHGVEFLSAGVQRWICD